MIFQIQVSHLISVITISYDFINAEIIFLGGYGNEVFDTISLEDRVYTFGGYWKNGTFGDHVYQFKNFEWSMVGNMIRPRGASAAVRFDREIFILGGYPNAEFYPV